MADLLSDIEKACCEGRSEEAERLLGQVPTDQTETAEFQCRLGYVRETQGRYEEAIEAYERALQLDATHRATLFHLAFLYDMRGEESLAIDYYKQCVQQPPIHEGALINLGVLYDDLGQYDEAIECFERLLAVKPNHARARLFLRDAKASKVMYYDEESERRRTKRSQVLEVPVTDFELSVRSRNCLIKMNIRTLGDLIRHTEQELLSYKNFGETSLQEIKDVLASKGLYLGMAAEAVDAGEASVAGDLLAAPRSEPVPARASGAKVRLADLEFGARSRKILERLGVETLGDLSKLTEEKLLACKNFGETSLAEVKRALKRHGLSLAG
ncbi:MAG TPA: DNA-directed RNA polymerase subunit alpha C-terminal domain-containing protein [Phycisphaerae bacterium]|nr:DNA-directed RNA polymerase subunit alpha C-terminal domain-containing protein [Phycisphaerae bacterium]